MGIATEYLTRLARLYREADADNRAFDEARRQKIIDDLTADIRAMLQQKKRPARYRCQAGQVAKCRGGSTAPDAP